MKTMTCKQLGGACDHEFTAETFEEMAEMSKKHSMEMFGKGDGPHLETMHAMKALMSSPKDMQAWFTDKKAEFEALPDISFK